MREGCKVRKKKIEKKNWGTNDSGPWRIKHTSKCEKKLYINKAITEDTHVFLTMSRPDLERQGFWHNEKKRKTTSAKAIQHQSQDKRGRFIKWFFFGEEQSPQKSLNLLDSIFRRQT